MLSSLGELPPLFLQGVMLSLVIGEAFLLGGILFLFLQNRQVKEKLRVFFSGKEARDLESVLMTQLNQVKELDQEIQELFEISNRLRELCLKSIHKTHVVRFNPFKEVGGNQSFSVVLLDGKNSGVVLSSLHTREGTRVYAKPVLSGNADGFPFTEEEKKVISEAMHGKPTAI